MTKRIVSGVFLLIALGALGLILAGALTSGEQLIVRFLTAVVVAALGLYVISDLRLQADDEAARARSTTVEPRFTATGGPPPQSTAAFMATVTGKGSTRGIPDGDPATVPSRSVWDQSTPTDPETILQTPPTPSEVPTSPPVTPAAAPTQQSPTATPETPSPYGAEFDDAELWPFNTDTSSPNPAPAGQGVDQIDDLVAIFTRQTASELAQQASASDTTPPPAEVEPPTPATPEPTDTSTLSEALSDFLNPEPTASAERDQAATKRTNTDPEPANPFGKEGDPSEELAQEAATDGDTTTPYSEITTKGNDDTTPGDIDLNLTRSEIPKPPTPPILTPAPKPIPLAETPIAPIIDLRRPHPIRTVAELEAAIRAGEIEVVRDLVAQGRLSVEGPVTDRDVRTMVYVAFTSTELRKILLSGGTVDTDPNDLDLGSVDVFTPAELEAATNRLEAAEADRGSGSRDGAVIDLRDESATGAGNRDRDRDNLPLASTPLVIDSQAL